MKKTLPFLSFSLSFSLFFFLFLSFFTFCVPTGVAMATPATPSNPPLVCPDIIFRVKIKLASVFLKTRLNNPSLSLSAMAVISKLTIVIATVTSCYLMIFSVVFKSLSLEKTHCIEIFTLIFRYLYVCLLFHLQNIHQTLVSEYYSPKLS